MVEEEITGGQDARTEGGQEAKNQTWHMRCTPSQKELLQQLVSLSGQSAAEFLLLAATESLPKSKAQSELEKDLSEMDSLIDRLTRMMRAKLVLAHEAQKSSTEEHTALNLKRIQIEEELALKTKESQKEIQEKREALEEEFSQKELQWEKALKDVDKTWENKWLQLKEVQERLESNLSQKIQDEKVREKQYADSVRLHENIEEKNFDLKSQNESLRKELDELKKHKDSSMQRITSLERQENALTHQLELQKMRQEEEIKRLESEYDLKCRITEFEIEKRIREEIRHTISDDLKSN